ncbi:prohead peptidase. Unknown type peptidase. MEROPS family U35 [Albimonas donghaensis]|uniref:Prohead serine protease domain-containing protein n=1 Tax=Albimonas donghaensis TaxID=356660 RepID=A0A1H2SWU7_9RHOB|nr:HK97 family phage prohead protease [Albimonas donghaensis]MAS44761.1 HK97 family phage prohead protease [Paracoccaceae bacterium]MBR28713.1 HK97 family phage prohead protease [Paracoccaceae bacterium]SDW35484.1 prohead peptidase. Unknown type peptidase. MEROPS family U35 [Albimonas donghaensis]
MTEFQTSGPSAYGLETKFVAFDQVATVADDGRIEGYASLFGVSDQSGDVVEPGAFAASLAATRSARRSVKLLWQHDPAQPIGVWDQVREDDRGLLVRGRLLTEVRRGAEALSLLRAGAVDGLSIGYRALKAGRAPGGGRLLQAVELWEVSLVTFPMLPEARASAAKSDDDAIDAGGEDADDAALATALADAIAEARSRFGG